MNEKKISKNHPFLDESFHIAWSQLTPSCVEADITKALEEAKQAIANIAAQEPGSLTFATTFLALENAVNGVSTSWGKVGHLDSVCNSPKLREAYNQLLPQVTHFFTEIYLDDKLYDVLKKFADSEEANALNPVQMRYVQETIADFQQQGADLPEEKKKRLKDLETTLSQLTQKFSENVLDSTNAWEKIIEKEEDLAGLPQSAKQAAFASAKEKGIATEDAPKWRFTLHAPSFLPIMQKLDSDVLRKEFWEASCTIGAQENYDNREFIWKILELRQEKAFLLGKEHFADQVLERRMAKNGQTALAFTNDFHARILDTFQEQIKELENYKAEKTQSNPNHLEPWEITYWSEKRKEDLYAFDDEDLRPYFPMNNVIAGMFQIVQTLYNVSIKERKSSYLEKPDSSLPQEAVEVWHPEVNFYEIYNDQGEHLGSFYTDWHPRESKRSGAWMNYLRTGLPPLQEKSREPHLGLICGNMTPAIEGKPALLTHNEVQTIFHEFGHLLHHLLGNVEIRSLSGVNVAWDFVELPSQFMENFCWERETLNLFARHHETGDPIPEELFQKMLAARNYMSATTTMRQLALGKIDLELHIHLEKYKGQDLQTVNDTILKDYLIPLKTKQPSLLPRFGHLFSNSVGYAAGYYSYKWAEVLDADAFTRFQEEGILNPKVGHDFKETILSKGNADTPEKLFHNFMGRDPDINALLVRSGLA